MPSNYRHTHRIFVLKPHKRGKQLPGIEVRIATLQEEITQAADRLEHIDEIYAPNTIGAIDDLSVDAVGILRNLPGVAKVTTNGVEKPKRRIVHILDWHFVYKDDLAADLRNNVDPELTDEEVDALHSEFLLQLELIQIEQMTGLRCLVREHSLREIWSEGLTKERVPDYFNYLFEVQKVHKQIVRIKELKGEVPVSDEFKLELIKVGVAGQLFVEEKIDAVLPLDELDSLCDAKTLSTEKVEAREDAMVKALGKEQFALVVLGGGHDLSDNVSTDVEYIRVMTGGYESFAME